MNTVLHNNKTYTFMQDAYICDNGTQYETTARHVDENGDEHHILVTWDMYQNHNGDDESDACDWDVYTVQEI